MATDTETRTWDDVRADALESLDEYFTYEPDASDNDVSDAIAELADSHVPVYNYERMMVAASDSNVFGRDLELASGGEDLIQLAGIAIYEALSEALHEHAQERSDAE